MAGIGFRLQKLFAEDYYSSRMKAYSYSLFVTAGPWLMVIGTITLIRLLIYFFYPIAIAEQQLFIVSVSYCFIFSQILYGMIQLPVTRYVADRLYDNQIDRVFASFLGVTKTSLAAAFLIWLGFAVLTPLPFYYDLLLMILFLALDVIWIETIYLTAAKNYQSIALAFLSGGVIAILGMAVAAFLRQPITFLHAQAYMLLGAFTFGILVALCVLSVVLVRMFPKLECRNQYDFLGSFDHYPQLAICGLLYNGGIWICNFIIWFGEGHQVIADSFVYNPFYDTPVFWAYLTIIPIYIIFTVSIETRFYERYKKFLGSVNGGGTLKQVEQLKEAMTRTLYQEIVALLRGQGMVTLLAILVAWIFISQNTQATILLTVFQLAAVGAFANGMVLVCTLMLLYFEDRKGAALASLIFFLANGLLTLCLLPLGYYGFGIGFAVGSVSALLFCLFRLFWFVKDVDYYLFCRTDSGRYGHRFFTRAGRFLNRFS